MVEHLSFFFSIYLWLIRNTDFAAYGGMANISVGENTVLALTPGPSVDAIRYADQHSTPNSNIMDSLDPVQALTRRRISGSAIYKRGPAEPLSDPLIARLLKHYVNNLACWVCLLNIF